MIDCREVVERAGDFLERRLRLRQRLEVLLHLALCRGCRAYLEQFRLTLRALGSRPAPAVEGREALLDRFRRHHAGEEEPGR